MNEEARLDLGSMNEPIAASAGEWAAGAAGAIARSVLPVISNPSGSVENLVNFARNINKL